MSQWSPKTLTKSLYSSLYSSGLKSQAMGFLHIYEISEFRNANQAQEVNVISKVQRYSRWTGEFRPELNHLVIIAPHHTLEQGIALARTLSGGVWLVGNGVTLADIRENFYCTELGGFVSEDLIGASGPVRERVIEWLEHLVPGNLSRVLIGAASYRWVIEWVNLSLLCQALREHAGHLNWHFTDPSWEPISPSRKPKSNPFYGVKFTLIGLVTLMATIIYSLDGFIRRKKMFAAIRPLKKPPAQSPPLWMILQNEWYRFNKHLIESLALPRLREGKQLGVLLTGELQLGARDEATLKIHGSEPFSGLGELKEALQACSVNQVVAPETFREYSLCLLRACWLSLRAIWRAASDGSLLDLGLWQANLQPHAKQLARLLTVDLLRAELASKAAELTCKESMQSPAIVISTGSNNPSTGAADLTLQRSGFTTIDYCHGAGLENWLPVKQSVSTICSVWIDVDVRVLKGLGHDQCWAKGMPVRFKPEVQPPASRPLQNVLLMTNYLHRDSRVNGTFPLIHFLHEFLQLAPLLLARRPSTIIRWRPHPADNPEAVRSAWRKCEAPLEMSKDTLEDDVKWADVIVSTFSTAAVEALLANKPVLIHALPACEDTRFVQAFQPERRFFRARDGANLIAYALDSACDKPERLAREAFFGPVGWPVPLNLDI